MSNEPDAMLLWAARIIFYIVWFVMILICYDTFEKDFRRKRIRNRIGLCVFILFTIASGITIIILVEEHTLETLFWGIVIWGLIRGFCEGMKHH